MSLCQILFADVDPAAPRRLDDSLRQRALPARVDSVETGAGVLDRLSKDDYDVLILGRTLRDSECDIFLEDVRNECPTLKIFVLLPREDPTFASRATTMGATAVFLKPPTAAELCDLLEDALGIGQPVARDMKGPARAKRLREEVRAVRRESHRPVKRERRSKKPATTPSHAHRRRASDWLLEDTDLLRATWDSMTLLMVVYDLDGRIALFNQACQRCTGYGADEVRGRRAWEFLVAQEGAAGAMEDFARLGDERDSRQRETEWIARDGSRRWISWSYTPLRPKEKGRDFILGTGVDLTPVRVAEQSAGLLRAIVSSSQDALIAQSLDGTVIHWNGGAEHTFGYRAGEVLGRNLPDLFGPNPPCSLDGVRDRLAREESSSTQETRCRRKDGRLIPVLCTPSPILNSQGKLIGISFIARDISDLKAVQRRKEAEERTTRVLAGAMTLGAAAPKLLAELGESLGWPVAEYWEVDEEADLLRHIHTWHEHGIDITPFVTVSRRITFAPGLGLQGRIWAERRPIWMENAAARPDFVWAGILQTAGLKAAFGFPVLARDRVLGVMNFFHRDAMEPDEDLLKTMEAIGGHIGLLLERNRAVRSMAGNESRMRAIVETAADGIITIDERGTIDSFNPAAEKLFGYSAVEVLGCNVNVLMPEPHRSEHAEYIGRYVRTGEKRIIGKGREVPGRRKDGTTFPLYLSVSEMFVDGRRKFTGILRDLTEMKAMQDEVVRNRSLAAIGEASAAIAHEIRNPLAAISAPLQIIGDSISSNDPRREIIGDVIAQVKRLDGVVRQLLVLSKPWTPRKEVRDLKELSQEIVMLFSKQAEFQKVRLALEAPSSVLIPVDASLLEQVLWNLLLNAAQAMPGGGQIRVVLEQSADAATLVVSDNGPGIPAEVRAKLFQPFFTTKSSGTGLGLATSRKIMDAHGGSLSLESIVGRGTTITLTLPRR